MRRHLSGLILWLGLAPLAAAEPIPAEKEARAVVERYFAAYVTKDLDGLMGLWSEKAPDYAGRKQAMKRIFAETGDIQLKQLTIVQAEAKDDAARLRVRVELAGLDKRSGKPHADLGKLNRVLVLKKAEGAWTIVRYLPAEQELFERLLAARDGRQAIYEDNKDILTGQFVVGVDGACWQRMGRGQWDEALRLNDLAFEIADWLGDKNALAMCHYTKGNVNLRRSRYPEALASFERGVALSREVKNRVGEAQALSARGDIFRVMGRADEALRHYQDCLKIQRERSDRRGEADTLNRLGVVYSSTGRYADALKNYQDSLAIARELRDRVGEGRALHNIGRVYQHTGRYPEALKNYQDSLAIDRERGDRPSEAITLNNIGNVCNLLGRYAEALRHYEDVLAIHRELKDRAQEAATLGNIGTVYAKTGRYTEALRHYQDGLKIARELHDRAEESIRLGNIANVYADMGRYAEALRHYQESLAIKRERGDRAGEAVVLDCMGTVYEATAHYAEALRHIREGLKIARELGRRGEEATALGNLGNIYHRTGRYDEAMRHHQDSLKLKRELGDREGEAKTLVSLGMVRADMGRYAEALRYYQDGLKIARELGDRAEESGTLNALGNLYHDTGRPDEALRHYQDSLALARKLGARGREATALGNIGIIHAEMGRPDEALRHYQDCLAIERELGDRAGAALWLGNIGNIHHNSGRYTEALRHYQDALAIARGLGDPEAEAFQLDHLGGTYRALGRYPEALERYAAGLKLAESIGLSATVLRCHRGIGDVHREQRHWPEAADAYRRAIASVEQLRGGARERSLQTSFFARNVGAHMNLALCLAERGRPEEAFAFAEQAKARALVDVLQAGQTGVRKHMNVEVRKGMSEDERRREQELQERLTALTIELEGLRSRKEDVKRQGELVGELERARQDSDAFRRELYLRRPEVQTNRAAFQPATLADLGRGLFAAHPKLVILAYLVADKETLLFVLTRGDRPDGPARLTVHRIESGDSALASAVMSFRAACQKPGGGTPDGGELYRLLLAPAEEALAAATQVIVLPDGPLHTLPFHALKDGEEGEYLVRRCAVGYAPSVTALLKMAQLADRRRQEAPGGLLAVGVSDFGRREAALPQAESEAKAVAALFGEHAATLLGERATRANLRAAWAGRRYLHLATHGRLNEQVPLYSAVVLSRSDERDEGLLSGRDLLDEELSAELAVLSACETGLGRQTYGEGMLGLTWAWFVAGVPSTVASQWSVADDSTAVLMRAFYAELKSSVPKAEALRRAQLMLLKDRKTRHPFYWAPFVLTGDPW